MADDLKDLKRQQKEMELRLKMEKKAAKAKSKQEKEKMRLMKKQDKMRKKLEKQGRTMPDEFSRTEDRGPMGAKEPEGKIAQAEVVEFKSKEWERRSVQSLGEIEKKIDRFSGRGVKGLEERYREKYGEDIKIPELYQIETKLEFDQSIDRAASEDEGEDDVWGERKDAEGQEEKTSFFGRSRKDADITVGGPEDELEPSFWDLSTGPMFFMKKYGRSGGGGKKAIMAIVDIIVLIVLFIPFTIIRLLTTVVSVRRRKKARRETARAQSF